LRECLADLPEPLASVCVARLAQSTRGLTGADLKAVVEDAKLLFAHNVSTGGTAKIAERYFLDAIETIRKNRRSYAKKRRVDFGESQTIGFHCGGGDKPRMDWS
jgi:SpoVK/Ycf46/Vps4 family AAA+-type ATPase